MAIVVDPSASTRLSSVGGISNASNANGSLSEGDTSASAGLPGAGDCFCVRDASASAGRSGVQGSSSGTDASASAGFPGVGLGRGGGLMFAGVFELD